MEWAVKRILVRLGVQGRDGLLRKHLGEGMHTIRRSGARAMFDHLALDLGNDKALLQVSVMLNHQGTQQTLSYIGLDIEREQLNDWLRGNSMYSPAAYVTNQATVTAIRPVGPKGGASPELPVDTSSRIRKRAGSRVKQAKELS